MLHGLLICLSFRTGFIEDVTREIILVSLMLFLGTSLWDGEMGNELAACAWLALLWLDRVE
jgi:hypothetical protein